MSVCYRVGLRGLVKRLCPAWIPRAVEIQVQSQPPTMSKKRNTERKISHPSPSDWFHQKKQKTLQTNPRDCISPNPDGPLAADCRVCDLHLIGACQKRGKYEVSPLCTLETGPRHHPACSNTFRHRAHCSPDKHTLKKKKKQFHPSTDVSKIALQQDHELAQSDASRSSPPPGGCRVRGKMSVET